MLVQMEVQIISEDNIVESLLIACKLLFMTMRVAPIKVIVTNVLCFDVKNWHTILATGDVVRRATLHSLWFVHDTEFWQQTLH